LVKIAVNDNGSPALGKTNSFSVIVPAVAPPVVNSISSTAGQVALTVTGAAGPDYIVLTSTNLVDWQALLTTNPPALPVTMVLTNSPDPVRFYRIQLGP
jgi:hypothetical protein